MQAKKQQYQVPAASEPVKKETGEQSLRGTFVSVMLLGAIVIVSWLGVLFIFLARN